MIQNFVITVSDVLTLLNFTVLYTYFMSILIFLPVLSEVLSVDDVHWDSG